MTTFSVQTDIDLPMIAVIGNQSAGKSSLIESISGITLPRSSGTCTRYHFHLNLSLHHFLTHFRASRCPTECKLSHSDVPWKCVVKLHFSTDIHGTPIPVRLVTFGDPITSPSLVEERIRRAQCAILNPSTNPQVYLEDDVPNGNEVSFSKNYVSLEISGSDLADLSFVDLPGLIASVGCGGSERDIELVKALVTSYIEKPSCVILLTVTCETDFENQGAYHLAECFDRHRKRTRSIALVCVGVLTKPDRIPSGDEATWVKMIKNETEPLVNNWYCVKQPSSKDIASGITWANARDQEAKFFAMTQPWCSLEPEYHRYLRTSRLTENLSVILSELIAKRLPEIQDELASAIQDTGRRMSELPKAPSGDPVNEVFKALNDFSRDISCRVEGTSQDGLPQAIRKHQKAFRKAIRRTAPKYVPWETYKNKNDGTSSAKARFLANEGDDEDEQEEEDLSAGFEGSNFWTELKSTYIINNGSYRLTRSSARTRELPDNYPFVVQKAYIQEFTKEWEQPATRFFKSVYATLKADLHKLVEAHFAYMGHGTAKQSILMIVHEHLDEAAIRTKSKIQWLLAVEKVPATLNTHYFYDYKNKFLVHYRVCRSDSNLLSKLKRIDTHIPPSYGKSRSSLSHVPQEDAISKILSGLSEIGIHVKAADLPKLLPPDPMEVALDIMASVGAYFQALRVAFSCLQTFRGHHSDGHRLRNGTGVTKGTRGSPAQRASDYRAGWLSPLQDHGGGVEGYRS
ncbi:P-loop containing nucleoside triphosphate hydrolase protein [Chiua virens]|nr:P-loop containing nucleoside triphosphate hydrolase protein [Chiua virens]